MNKIPATLAAAAIFLAAGACGKNPDALDDNFAANVATAEEVVPAPLVDPQERCSSSTTYDKIKRELFRQAVEVGGRDQAVFDKVAAYSFVRMDQPILRGHNKPTGMINCTGHLTLDLPPGLAVAGGANRLGADIGYTIHGDIVTVSGADPIITPLATLARAAAPPPTEPAPADPLAPPPDPLAPAPAAQRAPAQPSYNCAQARTRSERAICASSGLAALDRSMAAHYSQALAGADARTASQLRRTGERFIAYRERCPTDACIADAYRGRIREIDDIVRESR
jgi:hypothetical protein